MVGPCTTDGISLGEVHNIVRTRMVVGSSLEADYFMRNTAMNDTVINGEEHLR